jgi:hypothetical protein
MKKLYISLFFLAAPVLSFAASGATELEGSFKVGPARKKRDM